MKQIIFLCLTIFSPLAYSQEVLKLTPQQIEAIFMKENLNIIAEKMNINIADAEITQTKLWENPEISFGDINLWSTESQRDGEDIPGFWGNFGKNREFSIELSQLIVTANKKGKEVGMAKKQKEMTIEEFEDFLRNLKTELRTNIYETIYLQELQKVLTEQKKSLDLMILAFQKQYQAGNLAKTELLRLQSAKFELDGQINENNVDFNEKQKELKSLLGTPPSTEIEIEKQNSEFVSPESLNLPVLIENMLLTRPDLKRDQLEIQFMEKSIDYEKSLRVPDINLSAAYDRRGGVWRDYLGFGVSFEIPAWNRNQGAIKSAKFQKQQSDIQRKQNILLAQNEVIEAYKNYQNAYEFYNSLESNDLLDELDVIYASYEKNLLKRNISMLEFIDFFETYQSNKELLINAYKNICISYENLQNTLATEIKPNNL